VQQSYQIDYGKLIRTVMSCQIFKDFQALPFVPEFSKKVPSPVFLELLHDVDSVYIFSVEWSMLNIIHWERSYAKNSSGQARNNIKRSCSPRL